MYLDQLADELQKSIGVEQIVDLGVVYQGRIGYADCAVAVGIETWRETYFVHVVVVHKKSGGRNTRVIKWPYSRTTAVDLNRVIADLSVIAHVDATSPLPDTRHWLSRCFDRLLPWKQLGSYEFVSLLGEAELAGTGIQTSTVRAKVARIGKQIEVSLSEFRTGGAVILAQFPRQAIPAMQLALNQFARAGDSHPES